MNQLRLKLRLCSERIQTNYQKLFVLAECKHNAEIKPSSASKSTLFFKFNYSFHHPDLLLGGGLLFRCIKNI